MKTVLLMVLLGICVYGTDHKPVRLTYVTLGGSAYGVLSDHDGPTGLRRTSWFNSLKLTTYMKVFGMSAEVGVPLRWTMELYRDKSLSRYGLYPGDISVSIGKRFGIVTPRLLFKAPLGYPTRNSVAWIGSGNMRAGVGASIGLGRLMDGKLSFSGTAELLSTINDTTGYPRMGLGSLSGYGSVKAGYAYLPNLHMSLQVYTDYGTIHYSDWSRESQQSITIAPIVSVWFNPVKTFALSGWYGTGPKYSSLYRGTAGRVVLAGISTGYGF